MINNSDNTCPLKLHYPVYSKCLHELVLLVYCTSDCPAVTQHENEIAPRKKKTRQKDKEINGR